MKAAGVERPRADTARQKIRDGMKGLLTYHHPAVIKQLKIIGTEQDRNQQQLMAEIR